LKHNGVFFFFFFFLSNHNLTKNVKRNGFMKQKY
jgi:hypothetical protein